MNTRTPPPEKLSALIRLAIDDARRLDRERYMPTACNVARPRRTGRRQPQTDLPGMRRRSRDRPNARMPELRAHPGVGQTGRGRSLHDDRPTMKWRVRAVGAGPGAGGPVASTHSAHCTATIPTTRRCTRHSRSWQPADEMEFSGWDEFDSHLESLSERAREIGELSL